MPSYDTDQVQEILAAERAAWSGAAIAARTHETAIQVIDGITRRLADLPERSNWELTGADFTDGAGPDATCGCGEAITMYDGEWMHIINPELRGTDDHDAHPDDDSWMDDEDNEDPEA